MRATSLTKAHHPGILWAQVAALGLLWLGLTVSQLDAADGPTQASRESLWALRPITRPPLPTAIESAGKGHASHPVDRFVGRGRQQRGLVPLPTADRATLLRRVSLDLIGLPPTPEQLRDFLADPAPDAYERVVDRLLSSPQHGPRYARHWLDVLRFADVDGRLAAEKSLFRWRDWILEALNGDLPYDEFVCSQIGGDTAAFPAAPAATGLLARGARSANGGHALAFAAVETISTAFLGLTVGCAKCHDHMYDPISQREFYAMKSLFDPLKLKKTVLADAAEVALHKERVAAYEAEKAAIQEPMDRFLEPFRKRLFEERLRTLPPEVAAVYRKPEAKRTKEEKKVARDYGPIVRIDPGKIEEIMTEAQRERYREFRRRLGKVLPPPELPVLWSVLEDTERATQASRILGTGDPQNPGDEVTPGFPFAPPELDFGDGRRQTFLNWLTSKENPLFARVAVNRVWYWHFGRGIVETVSDFGSLGKEPSHPELLDWLASEFQRQGYSMKALHRLIVTSETYRLASTGASDITAKNEQIDAENRYLWRHPLRRLEAEPLRDTLLFVAGDLDLSLGGPSFRLFSEQRTLGSRKVIGKFDTNQRRRAVYMGRGYYPDRDLLPTFLALFDAEDGRLPCSQRERTITALQALFFENGALVEQAAQTVAARLPQDDPDTAVRLLYARLLSRDPTPEEHREALSYLGGNAERLAGLAWILINLDEFVFTR